NNRSTKIVAVVEENLCSKLLHRPQTQSTCLGIRASQIDLGACHRLRVVEDPFLGEVVLVANLVKGEPQPLDGVGRCFAIEHHSPRRRFECFRTTSLSCADWLRAFNRFVRWSLGIRANRDLRTDGLTHRLRPPTMPTHRAATYQMS